MMESVNLIRIFVSSPQDAKEERNIICDEIQKVNRIYGHRNHVVLVPFTSDDMFSQIGAHPQELVNNQLLRSCDALIACFKKRFGTPTVKHGSGTEEEIEIHRELNSHVAIYFEEDNESDELIQDPQLENLKEFRKRIQKSAYIEEFRDENDLREKISKNIIGYIENLSSSLVKPKTSISALFQDLHSSFSQDFFKIKFRWNSVSDTLPANQWKEIASEITELLLEIGSEVEVIMNGRESAFQKDIQDLIGESQKLASWTFTLGGSNGAETFAARMHVLIRNLEALKEEPWETYVATSIPVDKNS